MSILVDNDFGQIQQKSHAKEVFSLLIKHQLCHAEVCLYGGQVLSWQPQGEKEVFWLSKTTPFQQGKAIRGGIPLCWPWFGVHPDDTQNLHGNHGFARTECWQLTGSEIKEKSVEITLTLQKSQMHTLWPNAFSLKQVISFGEHFSQSLIMENCGESDAYYTGALHSYFRISSPQNTTVNALSDAEFDDKLAKKHCHPEPLINCVGPVDRVYHCHNTMQIVDTAWRRTLEVTATNTKQWVFWNPGTEVANAMGDIHDQGEQEFVCLEAANTEMQLIPQGSSVTLSQHIKVIKTAERTILD